MKSSIFYHKCGVWNNLAKENFQRPSVRTNGTRIILYDNMSTIAMSKFFTLGQCIELNHHFIRDFVENSKIELMFINTKEQMTDHKNFHSKQV